MKAPKTSRAALTHWFTVLSPFLILALSPTAQAWGPLGHRMVAETAAQFLERIERKKEPSRHQPSPPQWGGWGAFLSRHRFELGYYSILPDSHFRAADSRDGKNESPQHFFDIDAIFRTPIETKNWKQIQKELDEFPETFSEEQKYVGARTSAHGSAGDATLLGVAPWRAEQLMSRAWDKLKDTRKAQGGYQLGRASADPVRKIYDALTDLGILTHYTGDATMPLHATEDWNAYAEGQGGLHFYLENDCVDVLEPGLSTAALDLALKNYTEWQKRWRVAELRPSKIMINVFADSGLALSKTLELDRKNAVIKMAAKRKSAAAKGEDALRKEPMVGCPAFKPLLAERIAKAAVLTALLWKWVLPDEVDFSGPTPLKFSDFELKADYITPDFSQVSFLEVRKPGKKREL